MARSNRPHEYIVYEDKPSWPSATKCRVGTRMIPFGKSFASERDFLPATVTRYTIVKAYSASTAKEFAKKERGYGRCKR
mgnify:CR=1 FL=1